jgi:hypothetical protein
MLEEILKSLLPFDRPRCSPKHDLSAYEFCAFGGIGEYRHFYSLR